MLRKLSVIAAAVAMLGMSALPASAAIASHPKPHNFSIPEAKGVNAWGSYLKSGRTVKITVCVKDTSRAIDFAEVTGVAFSQSGKLKTINAAAFGYRHSACRSITTTYTAHLFAGSGSGGRNGGSTTKVKMIY